MLFFAISIRSHFFFPESLARKLGCVSTRDTKKAASVVSNPAPPSAVDLVKLEAEFDSEMQFRPLLSMAGWIVAGLLMALSLFHYYTAGFGLLRETTHRGIHMAFVLGLKATQAVTILSEDRFQYLPSWCQLTKVLSPGILANQLLAHTMRLFPSKL